MSIRYLQTQISASAEPTERQTHWFTAHSRGVGGPGRPGAHPVGAQVQLRSGPRRGEEPRSASLRPVLPASSRVPYVGRGRGGGSLSSAPGALAPRDRRLGAKGGRWQQRVPCSRPATRSAPSRVRGVLVFSIYTCEWWNKTQNSKSR